MACCKAENYKWCDELETVRHEGQEYCIFHAPAECAEKKDVEAFNKLVFKRIDEAKEAGKGCDLSGTHFPGDISFSRYDNDNPLPKILFFNACFDDRVTFFRVAFSGDAYFTKVDFNGNVYFTNAVFNGDANFIQATFNGDVNFIKAAFNGYAPFWNAAFSKYTTFMETEFKESADFIKAVFRREANFFGAKFNGDAIFWDASFKKSAFFNSTVVNKRSRFISARFEAESYFRKSELGEAHFDDCQFDKPVFFGQTKFSSGSFDSCFVHHRLEFSQADLSHVSFCGSPLESFRFIECTWPMKKGRRVVYDTRLVDDKGHYFLDELDALEAWNEDEEPPSPGALADIFRRLKKIAITEQDHALASDWHFNEKDMVRRDHWLRVSNLRRALRYASLLKKRWWRRYKEHTFRASLLRATLATAPRSFRKFFGRHPFKSLFQNLLSGISLELYRASSGYGERPLRALLLLLAFVAAPIIFSSDPGGFIPLVPAKLSTTTEFWLPFAKGLWRLLITVQAGMFALAVRNRMRR